MRHDVFFLLVFSFSSSLFAAQESIGDDGRQVLLNDDGTWRYTHTDRFAITGDGKRVRLKQDGSWTYVGEKSTGEKNTGKNTFGRNVIADQRYVDKQLLEVVLNDLVIESYRGKKSAAHKNSRKKTQSVFHLSVINHRAIDPRIMAESEVADSVVLTVDSSDFSVKDTDGREYPVLSVELATATIKLGEETTIVVRADGSPHWWTTKSMSLTIDKKVLASRKNIVLTRLMSSVKKKNVDGFD
ncbi:MAG: hypothetical protein V3T17_18390 [Pseudomonadales bacterium]